MYTINRKFINAIFIECKLPPTMMEIQDILIIENLIPIPATRILVTFQGQYWIIYRDTKDDTKWGWTLIKPHKPGRKLTHRKAIRISDALFE